MFIRAYVDESGSADVDLCGCEAYPELNDFNYQTASIEQSQAVVCFVITELPHSQKWCCVLKSFLFSFLFLSHHFESQIQKSPVCNVVCLNISGNISILALESDNNICATSNSLNVLGYLSIFSFVTIK